MNKAAEHECILNVLYGSHKGYPDDKLNECIKEFDINVRELEEELACKKRTLIDLRTERARRDINKKFGLKIGETDYCTTDLKCTKDLMKGNIIYADTDSIKVQDKKCKSCVYYDKLLNVCFHNSQQWKPVWDETEACEKWDNNPEHSLEE